MGNQGLILIKQLTSEDVFQNKEKIIQYIFESNINCSFMNEYSMEDATNKWVELYDYSLGDKALVYGAFENCDDKMVMVGFVWAYEYPFREDIHRLYVSILHVQQEYRRMGIGKQLMKKIEGMALDKGCHSIYLHAEGFNDRGIKFYNENGYETERVQLVKTLI